MAESLKNRKKSFTVLLMFLLIIIGLCFWISYIKHIIMLMILYIISLGLTVWGIEETWKKKRKQS